MEQLSRYWTRIEASAISHQLLSHCSLQLKECTEAVGRDMCVPFVVSKDTGMEGALRGMAEVVGHGKRQVERSV